MLRTDTALRPTQATEQVITPAGPAAPSAGFSAVYDALRREVVDFIRDGSPAGEAAAMPVLSAEGQALRRQVEASAAVPAGTQQAFLDAIAPAAQDAAERLGVAPELVAAHAALESGWGQRPLTHADGRDTHNLFGIKAGAGWNGDVVQARTTEYEGGTAARVTEPFRSYPDTASAFGDYAQLLLDNPRYRDALHSGADARRFADALARGGYATDPAYADKLARVAERLKERQP